uniref:Cytochrome c oxidase subunit 3 n=1 Tax=Wolfiporia cocos TaxID=81056 RepID=A0A7G7YDY4_9APHY|nr:cytochrome c oxidase subunit 3 [Wolfiporia cocos]
MITINRNLIQNFPFHLVEISPWPLLVSFTLLSMAIGGVMYMHGYPYGGSLLSLGFLLTASGMTLWFRDIIAEASYLGCHTSHVQKGLTIGVILFIISEVFAFLSIFWGFFHSSLSPAIEIGGCWPPADPFAIPLLNTILLLSSGAFVTFAHHSLIQGNREGAIIGTLLTIVLAIIFTALQYYEYNQASFTFSDSVYGSVFFASTGSIGPSITSGTIFIAVAFFRIINYHLTTGHHVGYEASILYWHLNHIT